MSPSCGGVSKLVALWRTLPVAPKDKPSPIRYSEAPPGSAHKRKKLAEKKVEALRKKLQALSYTMQGQDPRRLFAMFDTDHEGYKDKRWNYEEFKDAVVRGGQSGQISEDEHMQLFELVDGRTSIGFDYARPLLQATAAELVLQR